MMDGPCLEFTTLDFLLATSSKKTIVDGKPQVTEVPTATLISCAPMTKIDASEQPDTDTTSITLEVEERSSTFTSEVHSEHFKKVFCDTYGLTLGNWAKAAIADNTTTNRKACRILKLPHVG
mmetsp:Transcript_20501/g.25240  ORF Transcript_20501/g.25240 Transcript_20501/m.25240 type:complete len:122 (+) Transcript_20501:681-1046(+)